MGHLVPQHAGPVEPRGRLAGGGHADHRTRAGGHRVQVGQADHPRAEPLVAADAFGLTEDFHQRFARRTIAELLHKLPEDPLDVRGCVAGQVLLLRAVEPQQAVAGVHGLHGLDHVQQFQRVLHADVEGVLAECLVEHPVGLGLLACPHPHQAQLRSRPELLRHPRDRLAVPVLALAVRLRSSSKEARVSRTSPGCGFCARTRSMSRLSRVAEAELSRGPLVACPAVMPALLDKPPGTRLLAVCSRPEEPVRPGRPGSRNTPPGASASPHAAD